LMLNRLVGALLGCACGVLAVGSPANAATYSIDSVTTYDLNTVTLTGTGYNGVHYNETEYSTPIGLHVVGTPSAQTLWVFCVEAQAAYQATAQNATAITGVQVRQST
jgi:hypothetical protein